MSTYTVSPGESIGDVAMNATGNYANVDPILEANGLTDWDPDLEPGMVLTIPDNLPVTDTNTIRQLNTYPSSNNFITNYLSKLAAVFGTISDNWILATGFWNDDALWIDTKLWID